MDTEHISAFQTCGGRLREEKGVADSQRLPRQKNHNLGVLVRFDCAMTLRRACLTAMLGIGTVINNARA